MSRANELKTSLFIYLHDIHGVDSFFNIPTIESLADYVLNGDFVDTSIPDGISDLQRDDLTAVVANLLKEPNNLVLFAEEVLKIVENSNGELNLLDIENFETLCSGKTDLGKMLIEVYVDEKELEQITSISKDNEDHFQEFLDAAIDNWH